MRVEIKAKKGQTAAALGVERRALRVAAVEAADDVVSGRLVLSDPGFRCRAR